MQDQVTVISVAYNSDAVLPGMLDSVPDGVPVIVVDNGSTPPLTLDHPGVTILRLDQNQGFGRGCNHGAAAAATEYLLFLNPDARLRLDTLDALRASARARPDAAGWNPQFIDGRGRPYFKRRSKIAPLDLPEPPDPNADRQVGTLHGSCIFVARELFEQLGGFDPAIFLYHEDDDLALRLAEHGPLMQSRAAVVEHLQGRSSARSPENARLKAFHMARSRTYAYAKHGHENASRDTVREAVLGLLSPLNLLSARKRAKAIGFLRGALSARRDGGAFCD